MDLFENSLPVRTRAALRTVRPTVGAFSASGGTAPYTWSITSGSLPSGVTLGSNGSVSGTASPAGNYAATVQARDSQSATATAQLQVKVLGLAPATLRASATVQYSAALSAVGGTAPYTFSSSDLPKGFSLSGAGVFSGKADAPGTPSFTVQVADAVGLTTSAGYSLTIGQAPVSVGSGTLADAIVGTPYSGALSATGGTAPYTWSILSGGAPEGLWVDATGAVTGQATTPGSYSFGVKVTDATGGVASGTVGIAVRPALLKILTASLPSGVVGFEYSPQVLGVSGGASPYSFSVGGNGLPPGLSLAGPVIYGTPGLDGEFPFTITAVDKNGSSASATLSIKIRPSTADIALHTGGVSFSLVSGAVSLPPARTVGVQSTRVSEQITYTYAVSPASAWLSVSGGGVTPGSLSSALTGAALSLQPGAYSATVTVTCTSSSCIGKTQSFGVGLTVTAPPARLSVLTPSLSMTSTAGAGLTQYGAITLKNSGGGNLLINSITCNQAWCSVYSAPGVIAGGGTDQAVIAVNPVGLNTGSHRAVVTIRSSGGNDNVAVSLLTVQTSSVLGLMPSGASYTMIQGGTPGAAAGSFAVRADGPSVDWSASTSTNWLTLGASSGSASKNKAGTVTFSVNNSAAALPEGLSWGSIAVSSSGAMNSPQSFLVALQVKKLDSAPSVAPAGLLFYTSVGSSPAAKTVSVSISSAQQATYQASASSNSSAQWLSVSPSIGTLTPGSAGVSTVSVNAGQLAAGTYTGTVSYSVAGAGVRTVSVTLTVGNAGSSGLAPVAGFTASAGCTAAKITATQVALPGNFSIPAFSPAPIAVQVANDCGAAVTDAQVIATFSNGDSPLTLTPVSDTDGVYWGTWSPWNADAEVTVEVKATAGSLTATSVVSGTVVPNEVAAINPNGVTLPYNEQVGGALAPGSIVSIYGRNLAATTAAAPETHLPTSINNVGVTIGGIAAPLFYVSPGQINAQIPFELEESRQYEVSVHSSGMLSSPQTIDVAPAAPGLAATSDGAVIAQHWPDYSEVSADAPASPGEYIILYLVGMGATENPVASGSPTPFDPLSQVKASTTVTVGGQQAQVFFAGLTPGWVGLYQVNIQIPATAKSGNLELKVSQGDSVSNTTIIPVR